MMTELGNGSPEATPWVKFKAAGLYGEELKNVRMMCDVKAKLCGTHYFAC